MRQATRIERVWGIYRSFWDYVEVLKPRETALLSFIGACSAIIAGRGHPPLGLALVALLAVALGSAGTNGLTNYLDRRVDARMQRTRQRALPSARIRPAEKVLPLLGALLFGALALAWMLHPLCFAFGMMGLVSATIGRKSGFTHLLGGISGCAPVLVGYLAIAPQLDWTIAWLCVLTAVWVPLHVWSVMAAYREDYLQAGVSIFPVTWQPRTVLRVLFSLSVLVYGVSLVLWHSGGLSWLYFGAANFLGLMVVRGGCRLLASSDSSAAWRLYKLSSYPYLGLVFLTLCVDMWILG
ncbi:protoheme IX farnesyltransferase [Chloroflexota bacterium]